MHVCVKQHVGCLTNKQWQSGISAQYRQHLCSEKIRVVSERPEQIFMSFILLSSAALGEVLESQGRGPFLSAQHWWGHIWILCPVLGFSEWEAWTCLKQSKEKLQRRLMDWSILIGEDKLRELGLFRGENKWLSSYKWLSTYKCLLSIGVWKCPKGGWKDNRDRLFSVAPGHRTWGSRQKLKNRRVHLNISPFYCRVTKH